MTTHETVSIKLDMEAELIPGRVSNADSVEVRFNRAGRICLARFGISADGFIFLQRNIGGCSAVELRAMRALADREFAR